MIIEKAKSIIVDIEISRTQLLTLRCHVFPVSRSNSICKRLLLLWSKRSWFWCHWADELAEDSTNFLWKPINRFVSFVKIERTLTNWACKIALVVNPIWCSTSFSLLVISSILSAVSLCAYLASVVTSFLFLKSLLNN